MYLVMEWFGLWMYCIVLSINVLYAFCPGVCSWTSLWAMVELLFLFNFYAPTYDLWLDLMLETLLDCWFQMGEDFLCCVMYCYFLIQPICSLLQRIYMCFLWFFNCKWFSTITSCKSIIIHSFTFLYLFVSIQHELLHVSKQKLHIWTRCLRLANLSSYDNTFFVSIFFPTSIYIPELLL